MEKFLGETLKIKTEDGEIEGVMLECSRANRKMLVESNSVKMELKFESILDISLKATAEELPLKEERMYALFYEAFNVYGPFEEQFVYSVAYALKKFLKELSTSSVKIIVESDDVFGRIGLCFARLLQDKVKSLSLEIRCDLCDLNTLKYKNAYLHSGGVIENTGSENHSFTMVLFACNRRCSFEMNECISNTVILLDIPASTSLASFTGLGLGFIPENAASCSKSYYLVDVGFGSVLAKKYSLPQNMKAILYKPEASTRSSK